MNNKTPIEANRDLMDARLRISSVEHCYISKTNAAMPHSTDPPFRSTGS